ncbi:hypothetical protein [Pantanalinema sp. GBBB05]|uniref:hypothetical protein n=1 Tax=Pantanalinema sp. GBBB05 TaxID=2604139 RepID=UPI003D81739E
MEFEILLKHNLFDLSANFDFARDSAVDQRADMDGNNVHLRVIILAKPLISGALRNQI